MKLSNALIVSVIILLVSNLAHSYKREFIISGGITTYQYDSSYQYGTVNLAPTTSPYLGFDYEYDDTYGIGFELFNTSIITGSEEVSSQNILMHLHYGFEKLIENSKVFVVASPCIIESLCFLSNDAKKADIGVKLHYMLDDDWRFTSKFAVIKTQDFITAQEGLDMQFSVGVAYVYKLPVPKEVSQDIKTMQLDVFFQAGKYIIKDNYDQFTLAKMLKYYREFPSQFNIVLVGYASLDGTIAINNKIKRNRAIAARDLLYDKYNIRKRVMKTYAYGEEGTEIFSLDENATPDQMRKVSIKFILKKYQN